MGDKSLMKKIIISLGAIGSLLFGSPATNKIDDMVDQIKAPREGVDLKELSATMNPFVSIQLEEVNSTIVFAPKKKNVKMVLSGIMNGRAFVNGNWYKEGQIISDYNLTHIGKSGVVLVKEKQVKKLFLHRVNSDAIKIKDGK